MINRVVLIFIMCLLAGCASTTSITPSKSAYGERVAVMPLYGEYGDQAADMIAQELLVNGYRVVERTRITQILNELGYLGDNRFDQSTLPIVGKQLGLKRLFVGSITSVGGPLYSFRHVNMNLRLVDAETGEILWAAKYGNPMWTSAVSTQGDIQRGANHLIANFVNTYK